MRAIQIIGMASRQPSKPVTSGELMSRSRAVVGFWLAHCFSRPELLQPQLAELLGMVVAGTLTPQVGGSYPLGEAAAAHQALRGRGTTGKLLLDCTR